MLCSSRSLQYASLIIQRPAHPHRGAYCTSSSRHVLFHIQPSTPCNALDTFKRPFPVSCVWSSSSSTHHSSHPIPSRPIITLILTNPQSLPVQLPPPVSAHAPNTVSKPYSTPTCISPYNVCNKSVRPTKEKIQVSVRSARSSVH